MIPDIPWYITPITLGINLVVAAGVWRVVAGGAGRSGLPPATQRRVRLGAGLFLGGWLGLALLFSPGPASLAGRDPFLLSPLILPFAAGGIGLAFLAIALWPALRRSLAAASLPALVGVQVYRTVGFVFLLLLALGQLPAHFALPAGWGDVAIGLTAPLVALALARGMPGSRVLAVSWNLIGLADLVVAVGMGTGLLAPLLMPELGARVPAAAAMGIFPLFLVPVYLVPLSTLLHLVALRRLAGGYRLSAVSYQRSMAGG